MRIIYFFFLATLLWSFWKAIVRLRGRHAVLTPILGWIVGLGFFNLAPLTVMVFNGGYEYPLFYNVNTSYATVDLSNIKYFIPVFVIWMSLLFSFVAVILFSPANDEKRIRSEIVFNESKLRSAVLITAGFTMLDYVLTIWAVGGLQAFVVSHWYNRGVESVARLGDVWVLYLWLSQANLTVFTAAAALYTHSEVRRRKLNWRFSAVILSVLLLHVAMMGDRIFLALYLLSFAASCWVYRRKKLIAVLLMIAPALVLVFSAWAYFRNDLPNIGENIPTYVTGDLGNRAVTAMMDAFDGTGTMLLFHIITDVGDKYDYMYGASYGRAAFFMVPRRFYPEKPPSFAEQLAIIYEPGEITSVAVTQLGELYANFGVLSVLLLPFVTVVILLLSEMLTRKIEKRVLLSGVLFLLSIWLARAAFVDNLITLIFGFVLIKALRLERGLCFKMRLTTTSPLVSP
jgi:hypothetical protein